LSCRHFFLSLVNPTMGVSFDDCDVVLGLGFLPVILSTSVHHFPFMPAPVSVFSESGDMSVPLYGTSVGRSRWYKGRRFRVLRLHGGDLMDFLPLMFGFSRHKSRCPLESSINRFHTTV